MALDQSEQDFPLKLLGKYLFFDQISVPSRQACATCHAPDSGWTNGTAGTNKKDVAVTGANPHTVGTLKPPSNAYASFLMDFESPCLSLPGPAIPSGSCGGNFWNGRATGDAVRAVNNLTNVVPAGSGYEQYLGPTADQAHASPFINPVEQGVPNIADVCQIVRKAQYAPLYAEAYGEAMDCGAGVQKTFARFALAISAYQHSKEVNAFDSKRDRALAADSDGKFPLDGFTEQENLGHNLFYNTALFGPPPFPSLPVTNCAFCHNSSGFPIPQANPPFGNNTPVDQLGVAEQELYTDLAYHNIGTPRNTEVPGNPNPDPGLAATTGDPAHTGAHKTPTLRNVDKRRGAGFTKAYTHNGWFKSLESLVHFYNTSDVDGPTAAAFGVTRCPAGVVTEKDALANNCWPAPENVGLLSIGALTGDMGMNAEQEAALVAYLKTLTDLPTPKPPAPFNMTKFQKGQLE